MSVQDFITSLLDGAEVEWKPLGEVGELKRGKRLIRSELEDRGDYAVYQNSMKPLGYYHDSNVSNDSVFVITAGAAGEIGYSAVPCWAADDVTYFVPSSMVASKFIYHFLLTQKHKFISKVRRASIPRLSRRVIENTQIPIPCPNNPEKSLQIQAEIVRVLDTFTELTTELTTELNARKKQFSYYRDLLLSFDKSEVEWQELGSVVKIKHGKDWKTLEEGNYPVYGSGGIMRYVNAFIYDKPTVLIPRKGSISNIFYVDEPFWNVDTIYYTEINKYKILPKFLYYFMKTINLLRLDTGAGRPSLTQSILNRLHIPLPSLKEQARIVAILDKFDALTASITEGLPKEIALRNKQYEYYRDMLFNFPQPGKPE